MTCAGGRTPRLLFYVQHLLGIGHLVRAARVAKALAEEAFAVTLVLGGAPPPSLDAGRARIVALPPIKVATGGFSALVHADGRPFEAADKDRRRDRLLACFAAIAPDVLIVEAFPFGRRQMRFELLPLLEAARACAEPPLVVSSVRDILQASRAPERLDETVQAANRFFDLILVHGDPRLARVEESFPLTGALRPAVAYSGLVAPNAPALKTDRQRRGVIVSVGGGAVGAALLQAALEARPLSRLRSEPWLFLTGPNLPEAARAALQGQAASGVEVRGFVPDLAGLLSGAVLSISQAGYNTVADILVAGCRSVLVPFAAGGETEQGVRAEKLERLGLAVAVSESDLSPATLARAIDRALDHSQAPVALDLDGARRSAILISDALATRERRP